MDDGRRTDGTGCRRCAYIPLVPPTEIGSEGIVPLGLLLESHKIKIFPPCCGSSSKESVFECGASTSIYPSHPRGSVHRRRCHPRLCSASVYSTLLVEYALVRPRVHTYTYIRVLTVRYIHRVTRSSPARRYRQKGDDRVDLYSLYSTFSLFLAFVRASIITCGRSRGRCSAGFAATSRRRFVFNYPFPYCCALLLSKKYVLRDADRNTVLSFYSGLSLHD